VIKAIWRAVRQVLHSTSGTVGMAVTTAVLPIEREHTALALQQSEERFRDFAEAASDWFWEMDETLRFTFFSDRREQVTGLPPADALGRTRWEIVGVDPDQDAMWREHRATLEARLPFRDFTYDFFDRRQGRAFTWKVSGKPVFSDRGTFKGYRGTCTDISAEVDAKSRAAATQELLLKAIEAMPEGFALYDQEERLVLCNRNYSAPIPAMEGAVAPGMRFEDVIRAAARCGYYQTSGRNVEDVIRDRIGRHRDPRGPFDLQLASGQWVRFHEFKTDDGGTVVLRFDITAQRRALEQAARSHLRLVDAVESIPASFILYGPDNRLILWNSKAPAFFPEITDKFVAGNHAEDLTRARYQRTMANASPAEVEARVAERLEQFRNPGAPITERLADGRWTQAMERRTSDGGTVCIRTDISDRLHIEDALRESQELLQAVIDAVPATINVKDTQSRYVMINRYQAVLYGTTKSAAVGRTAADFMSPEHAAFTATLDRRVVDSGSAIPYFEQTYADRHGVMRTWLTTKVPLKEASGRVKNVVTIALDITDRKRAEQALRDSEQRFRDVSDSAGDWIWEMGPDLRFSYLSPRFFELFPIPANQILGKKRDEFAGPPADDARWRQHLDDLAARRSFRNFQYSVHLPDGSTKYIRISGKTVYDADGAFRGYRGTGTDVTHEVEAEAMAAKAEEHLAEAIESIPAGFALYDEQDRLVVCNRRYRERYPGLESLSQKGVSFEEMLRTFIDRGVYHSTMGESPEDIFQKRLALHRDRPSSHEQHLADDRWIQVDEYSTHDGGSLILRTDITERKLLQNQLAEAQKMEAIGQLTGGVAHDFNNLLSIILGNLKLIERRATNQEILQKHIRLASGAAERGAELTRRLLAFSRRQVLEPAVIDVNQLIGDMDGLLRRTLGEHVEIDVSLADDLWPVRVDPAQLESALLNLAINARDAMPEGGKLTIETTNAHLDKDYAAHHAEVTAGDYVLIAVADTGVGMPPEVMGRIFEPFFTTKEVGKGTGLGLSMVYGFVKQSGGHVKAYSEKGYGTVMKVYLPRTAPASITTAPRRAVDATLIAGHETILVVEDDPEVRQTAVALLGELGYRVVEAENGPAALELLNARADIDLLFTDVVMPGGMKGSELAREALKRRPGLKVLYTSGYTENGAFHGGMVASGSAFISKPLQLQELAVKVRAALDS
jgi:PAS domain S-box-containing protein